MCLSVSDQIAVISVIGVYIGIFISVFEMWHPFRQRAGDTDPELPHNINPSEEPHHKSNSVPATLDQEFLAAVDLGPDLNLHHILSETWKKFSSFAATTPFPDRQSDFWSLDFKRPKTREQMELNEFGPQPTLAPDSTIRPQPQLARGVFDLEIGF
ncbi:hypothetical protein IWZ01DRAFT_540427 [Phyllosticta capitalensis]